MKFPSFIVFLLLSLCLSSCSSSEKKEAPPLMSQKMSQRLLARPDQSRRSIYDKDMQATLSSKPSSTDWLGRKKFSAKKFGGNTEYAGTSAFNTGEFTSGKDQPSFSDDKFSQAGKKSGLADQSFETKKSWFGRRSSRDATKAFTRAGDTFQTSSNRAALAAQEKNDRPQMIELEAKNKTPAYSEAQVRTLMGRD